VLVLLVLLGVAVKARRGRTAPAGGGQGYLSLRVVPWGTVQSLTDAQGAPVPLQDAVTPLYAPLPAGDYTAVVEVARTGKTLELPFTIRSGEVTAPAPPGAPPDYAPFLDRIR
jgi:hypothetical protein